VLKKRLWITSIGAIIVKIALYFSRVNSLYPEYTFIERIREYNTGEAAIDFYFNVIPFIFFVILFYCICYHILKSKEQNKTGFFS